MKPLIRYTGTIAVTAMVALAVAVSVFGAKPADAQPAPQTAPQPAQTTNNGAVPAPPVQQADKGAASSSAVGSAAQPGPTAGSGAPSTDVPAAGSGGATAEAG